MIRSSFLLVAFTAAIVTISVNSAQATLLSVANPSFEDVDGDSFPIGWGCDPGDADYPIYGFIQIGAYAPVAPPDGANVAYLFDGNWGDVENNHILAQTLSDVLTANTTYTLDIEVGRPDFSPGTSYEIQLLAGSTVIATTGALDSSSYVGDVFFTSTISFPATLSNPHFGEPLTVAMIQYGDFVDNEIDFDNVRLDATAVPEPSTLMLSGLGAICLLAAAQEKSRGREPLIMLAAPRMVALN